MIIIYYLVYSKSTISWNPSKSIANHDDPSKLPISREAIPTPTKET